MKQRIILFLSLLVSSITFGQTSLPVSRSLNFNPLLKPFYHGVASGDPLRDRVIIWTRVTPDSGFVGSATVQWRVAADTGMTSIVQQGTYTTDNTKDYTVKVDVTGLSPNTYYYYEFTYDSINSIRGRTRTAPVVLQDSLRFAVVSCSNYEAGFFNVYRAITERNDVDAVIHLGDYIYEYEHTGYSYNSTANRPWEPSNEIISLSDYRTRYSCYHLDEDLIRIHQQYPFIIIWDDHESANDSWMHGAGNHNAGEGPWVDRKASSQQAFMEWLPVRPKSPGNITEIYRKISFGPLVDFLMLDTRLIGREEQAGTTGSTVTNPNRTLLGTTQYNWFTSQLMGSSAHWKVIGQQVMMAPLKVAGIGVNGDQWDGYPAERTKITSFVTANSIQNVAVITGDIHTSWANDIPTANYQSNGNGSAFVEFVTPSVTSPGFPIGVGTSIIRAANNHIKYVNLDRKGFILLDITQTRIQADWFFVATIDSRSNGYSYAASWQERSGERFLREGTGASAPRHGITNVIQAPEWPRVPTQEEEEEEEEEEEPEEPEEPDNTSINEYDITVIGVYPNPFTDGLSLQMHIPQASDIRLTLINMEGRQIAGQHIGQKDAGLHFITMDLQHTASGIYWLNIQTEYGHKTIKIIKQ